MRAITVRQPWAHAVAVGAKTVENRSQNTVYRGEIAIHAARTVDTPAVHDSRIMKVFGAAAGLVEPLGAIIAVAELVDCHRAAQPGFPADGTCCSPWGNRVHNERPAFHLMLAHVRRLAEPVSCRGYLHVGWAVPESVAAEVRSQLLTEVTR
ncbi:MAG: hypothetical protein ABW022_07250 [Actinoplanes sp.]